MVIDDTVRPNGLAFSVDGRTLYVSNTGMTHDPACPPISAPTPSRPTVRQAPAGLLWRC